LKTPACFSCGKNLLSTRGRKYFPPHKKVFSGRKLGCKNNPNEREHNISSSKKFDKLGKLPKTPFNPDGGETFFFPPGKQNVSQKESTQKFPPKKIGESAKTTPGEKPKREWGPQRTFLGRETERKPRGENPQKTKVVGEKKVFKKGKGPPLRKPSPGKTKVETLKVSREPPNPFLTQTGKTKVGTSPCSSRV